MGNNLIFHNNLAVIDKDGTYNLNLSDTKEDLSITIKKDIKSEIKLIGLANENNISFIAEDGSNVTIKMISNVIEKDRFKLVLNEYLGKNSNFNCYFADFSEKDVEIVNKGLLAEDNANINFYISSLTKKSISKKYEISFDHSSKNTFSNLNVFGVCLDESEIDVKGISHIEKASIKSNANQSVKIILFDKTSKAKASPTLKIDCDDIKASHGCAIGCINEDHLFYLTSRGLSLSEARKLITLGYLMPIANYFNEDDEKLIENYVLEEF